MSKFISSNYDRDAMVVSNFQEQCQPNTFEYAVHYLSDRKLDTPPSKDKELEYDIDESYRIVCSGLTKKKQKELGVVL